MKKYIVFNWKCNPEILVKAKQLFESAAKVVAGLKGVEVVICPPFPYISQLKTKDCELKIGAQNCFWKASGGPYTGEVSPLMLKNMGCEYVILGHSERKRVFGETEEVINKKLKAVLSVGLQPILFFGEMEQMTDAVAKKEIIRQLEKLLAGVEKQFLLRILFVYEPAFAVSTQGGKPLDSKEVEEKHMLVRKYLSNRFGLKHVILYGGSVDEGNLRSYLKETGIDGVVIGQASINSKKIEKVIKVSLDHG